MKKIIMVMLLVSGAVCLYADTAGIPMEIFYKGFGVRSLSMGGAALANVNDATSVYWNPADLEDVSQHQIYASFETYYGGAHFDNLAYSMPMGRYGGAGVSVSYMGYGSYDLIDVNGNQLGTGTVSDMFVTIGYGKDLFYNIKGGFNIKPLFRTIGSDTFSGVNADISFSRSFDKYVDAAVSFRNILPLAIQYSNDKEDFMSSCRLGIDINILDSVIKIAADAEKYFYNIAPLFYAGIEYNIIGPLYLRAGYNNNPGDITAGIGITINDFVLDYGIDINSTVTSNKIAVSYRFGGYELALKADQPIFSPLSSNNKCYIRIISETKYEVYKWLIEIKDSDGKTIKTWEGAGKPSDSVTWDGLRDDGMPQSEGTYTLNITATDENGTVIKSNDIKIKISNNVNFSPVLE